VTLDVDPGPAGPPLGMMDAPLHVDWCSYDAARHAIMRWHYSRRMPRCKLAKLGVWEHGRFVGAIVYGRGATPQIGSPYGLDQTEVCELVRVALRDHVHPVTQMLAATRRRLRETSPGLRLVVSFADPAEGHHGGIYQADNWLYLGLADDSGARTRYIVNGVEEHPRTLGSRYGQGGQSVAWLRENIDPDARRIYVQAKHRYAYPLDRRMRRQLAPLVRAYPDAVSASQT
jgi:hypothetical protein